MSKNTPVSQVTDPSFQWQQEKKRVTIRKKSEGEEALATAIVDYHIPQPQRKFPIPYYKALNFSIECRPQYLRQRERKWAWCLSLDTGCAGACELKYQPLLFYTVKEWQPHDSLCTSHANTQWMHVYRYQNLFKIALSFTLASVKIFTKLVLLLNLFCESWYIH